jgi:dTDP-4-amino-4,6-dideoxygalactose transaminase
MTWNVPLAEPDLGDAEIAAVVEVLRSRWLTMGEVTLAFEKEFAAMCGVKHAVAVTNCTVGLELAYRAVGVSAGDEVILPSLTFVATANAALALSARPVFADVIGDHDLNVSPEDIAQRITSRTRAIAVVHYGGHLCRMEEIAALARAKKLALIEDCAHAPGASLDGRCAGTFGDLGCFSFFSNKNLTTGEGGMITTDRDDLAARLRLLRSHGMTTLTLERHRGHSFSYDVLEPGHNARIDELRSAIGRVQLRKLEAGNRRRAELVARYHAHFAGARGLSLPFAPPRPGSANHLMVILLDDGAKRVHFMEEMKRAGIQTSIHYPPTHTFSYYARAFPGAALPRTTAVQDRLVTLPLHPGLSDEAVAHVAGTARAILGG